MGCILRRIAQELLRAEWGKDGAQEGGQGRKGKENSVQQKRRETPAVSARLFCFGMSDLNIRQL